MKKILYANLRDYYTVEGHKLFDVNWAKELLEIGEVDLVGKNDKWYTNVPPKINVISYNPEQDSFLKKILKLKIFNSRMLKHLNLYGHWACFKQMKFILKLDKERNYDFMVFSTIDIMVFPMLYKQIHDSKKRVFIIEHTLEPFKKKTWRYFFDKYKNDVNHIVMEKLSQKVIEESFDVDKARVSYIPHPLNIETVASNGNLEKFDIVAISNSNSNAEVDKLIQLETEREYFKKKNLKVLIRSQCKAFDDGYLKVFSGRLSLSYQDYVTYIRNAKVVLIPFEKTFGDRTSGTIIDALSNDKFVLGTFFSAFYQFTSDYPNVCKIYKDFDDFDEYLTYFLTQSKERPNIEFDRFKNERSIESIVECIKYELEKKNV